jgi:peptidoglycan hydrolase-like protein with peptidoglycan-binding domain
VEAMRKFQDAHGLNPSGKLDAKTLQQLGLGSQTAGVAAPLPPTSSTSTGTRPTQTARRQP